MNISNLYNFIGSAKANIDNAIISNLGDTYVVLGNEAADLDSTISSLVLAYYTAHSLAKEEKENKVEGQQSFIFPVINCTREDLPLRTEVNFFLKANSIRPESLICRDEIDLIALQAGGKLKLTLVDHNVLSAQDSHLFPSIARVIDHHKRERPLDRRDIIEPVGSCATLIAEIVLGLFDKDPLVCRLLYGTIIFDTVNLSESAKRVTSKDLKIVKELEDCLNRQGQKISRDEIYQPLMKARADISCLSPEQLLRKDCKVLRTPEITISVPAIPLLSQKFLELPGASEALRSSLRSTRCTAIVVLGWEITDIGDMRRDITIFSDSIHKAKQVCNPLKNCENLQLTLLRNSTEPGTFWWTYEQRNIGLSRKFILPFLVSHFEAKAQNLDVDALAGVEILMPNGEISPSKTSLNSVPSISYTAVQNLGIGDPISQGGSSQSSAYNSCPYTPQNSCAEPEEGYPLEHYFLPSFNSREMIEKIELKRGKLRGYSERDDERLTPASSYPFTPKNSYVESSLDAAFGLPSDRGILHAIDSEVLLRKLMEKRRTEPLNSSNSSSKSQSLTKLNFPEEGDCAFATSTNKVTFSSRATEIPDYPPESAE